MLQSYKATKLQSYKATKLQSHKATKLQSYKATKLQSYKATKPQSYKATKLQSYKATKLQSHKATKPLFTQQLESQHSSHSSWRDNTCVGILAYDHIRKKHKLSKNKEPFILLLSSTLLRINRLT